MARPQRLSVAMAGESVSCKKEAVRRILKFVIIRGSSNGRTADSGSANLGSNPSPRARHAVGRFFV